MLMREESTHTMTSEEELRQAIERGLEMAQDPQNATIHDPCQSRITTIYSPWLLHYCRVCRHTFREGDLVRPDPKRPGAMLHEDHRYGLHCWSKERGCPPTESESPACDEQVHRAFLRGIEAEWTPVGHTRTERVEASSDLIGRKCPICRHTVRVGDHVVRSPGFERSGGVFHQDMTRHLTCWDTWNRSSRTGVRDYCAFTGASLTPEQLRNLFGERDGW